MKEPIEKYNPEDDDLYILGGESDYNKRMPWWAWLIVGLVAVAVVAFVVLKLTDRPVENPHLEHSVPLDAEQPRAVSDVWLNNVDAQNPSTIVVTDTVVDSLQLKILTPYNVTPELHLGQIDTTDSDILFAARAADLGSGKGLIIGAFVHEGTPLSWGLSKLGYCAIIDGKITLGVAENSPLFEQATEKGGSFFRQYAAVDNGSVVLNNPENASFRRALCDLDGNVCVVVSVGRVLMDDFSRALAGLGVRDAVFLVGGTRDGWYRDSSGTIVRLGEPYNKNNPNINYLVFRAQ